MRRLQQTSEHDNHFNLIRMVAAMTVLVSHSGLVLGAAPFFEPSTHGYVFNLGGMSVNIFFVVSGFLVTGSLLRRDDVVFFLTSRFLRIFPGLWVMLALTVFGLGLAMTTLPAADYLLSPETRAYLLRCASVVGGMGFYLPGVFTGNVFDQNFNKSLWTLPQEWALYQMLAIAWLALGVFSRRLLLLRVLAPLTAVCALAQVVDSQANHSQYDLSAINLFMFATGACFSLFRDRVVLSNALIPLLLGLLAFAALDVKTFYYAYILLLPPLVLQLAYARCDALLRFNRVGDYSYGVYIYGFPIQQGLAQLAPGLSVGALSLFAGALTLGMAILSWRLVEKPALAKKGALADAIRALLRPSPQPAKA